MRKTGLVFFLLLLLMTITVAGCAVGPCAGYGCPAMASTASQTPPPAKNAQLQQVTTPTRQAQNEAVRPTVSSGQ